MFLTVSVDLYPLLDTGLSAGVAIATPASKISSHLRLPLRTSPAWTVCCWITFNFLQEIISFWYKGSIKL